MDLEEFVNKSLVQIASGVQKAQSEVQVMGARINPESRERKPGPETIRMAIDRARHAEHPIQNVDFDLAVTVTEEENAEGGVGAFITLVGAGVKGQTRYESSSTSRIKFSVPILLPMDLNKNLPEG